MAFIKGMKRPEGAGRKKGTPNKASADHRAFCQKFLTNKEYRQDLERRIRAGKAIEIEKLLYQYAYGKPPDKVELTGKDGQPLSLPQPIVFYLPNNRRNQANAEVIDAQGQVEQGS